MQTAEKKKVEDFLSAPEVIQKAEKEKEIIKGCQFWGSSKCPKNVAVVLVDLTCKSSSSNGLFAPRATDITIYRKEELHRVPAFYFCARAAIRQDHQGARKLMMRGQLIDLPGKEWKTIRCCVKLLSMLSLINHWVFRFRSPTSHKR